MRRHSTYILALLIVITACIWTGGGVAHARTLALAAAATAEGDSVKPRYSVRKTYPETFLDLQPAAVDLKNPEGLVTEVEYDEKANIYKVTTKVGSLVLGVPYGVSGTLPMAATSSIMLYMSMLRCATAKPVAPGGWA